MSQNIAVVTGANKGIGMEIARSLGKMPNTLAILACRNAELGEKAADELKQDGCNVAFMPFDLTSDEAAAKCADQLKVTYGGIDVLVNNAAIAFKGKATEPFAEQAKVTVEVNYFGTLRACKYFAPLVKEGGRIVNLGSMAGKLNIVSPALQEKLKSPTLTVDELSALANNFIETAQSGKHQEAGWPNGAYGPSKVLTIAFSMILARELKSKNILVNACCPGWCATDMSSHSGPKSAAAGAETPIMLATLPKGSPTGEMWSEGKIVPWAAGTW